MYGEHVLWSTTKGEWKPTNAKDGIPSQCEILPLMSEVKGFSTEKGVLSLNPSRPHPKCHQGVLQAQAAPFKQGIITDLSP